MSTRQRLTLIGLHNYEQQNSRDLFSTLSLPEGYDKPTFINSLLLEHGEKCVLYTNPDFFRYAIGIWSGKWELELGRIYEALTAKYNPIYNYDRYEESADGRNKNYKSDVDMGERSSVETIGAGNRSEETEAGGRTSTETNASGNKSEETNAGGRTSTETNATGNKSEETNAGGRTSTETNASGNKSEETNAGGRTSTETNASAGKTEHSEAGHVAQDNPNYKDEQKNDYDVTNSQSVSASVEHEVSADNSATYQPDWKETTNAGTTKQENDGTITHTYTGSTQDLREQSTNDLDGHENSNSKTDGEEVRNSQTIGQDASNTKTDGEEVRNSQTIGQDASNTKTDGEEVRNSQTVGQDASNTKTDGEEVRNSQTVGQDASNTKTDGEEVSNSRTIGQDSASEKTDGENVRNSKTRDSELENNEHRAHLYGNIGVTTSASMVTEIVQQRINMNLYDIATRLFANELLIGIY